MRNIAIIVALLASLLGCAKSPLLLQGSPMIFTEFSKIEDGRARLLAYRPYGFTGSALTLAVDADGCKFELGVNQFAVCEVDAGRVDLMTINALSSVEIEEGGWGCTQFKVGDLKSNFKQVDCAAIAKRIPKATQVWTTQSSLEFREVKAPPRRSQSRKRIRAGTTD